MKNFVVNVSTKTSKIYLEETSVAVDGENIAGQVIFKFNDDEFIDGIARLEWQNGSDKYFQIMEKVGKTYVLPIKNVMTKEGKMYFQLVITQPEIGEEIPVFKSNQFYVYVEKSINAEGEAPSGYDTWLDYANAKLLEMDNLNITASKSGNTETITLTDKQGNEHKTYIYDGEKGETGPQGPQGIQGPVGPTGQTGPAGQDGKDAKINGVNTIGIVAGDNITIEQTGNTLTINGAAGSGYVDDVLVNGTSVVENKIANVSVPTKVSELTNDSGFIINTVNNLTNYYTKNETYTKSEVNTLIGNIEKLTIEIVQTLPQTGESNVLYLVPKEGSTNDVYDEYLYINNSWEHIGSTEIDLSNYYTKDETKALLEPVYVTAYNNNTFDAVTNKNTFEKIINQAYKNQNSLVTILGINTDSTTSKVISQFSGYLDGVTQKTTYLYKANQIFNSITLGSYRYDVEYTITGSWTNNVFTLSTISRTNQGTQKKFLTADNTSSYTPENNYNPAHKLYVDTAVANKQDMIVYRAVLSAKEYTGASLKYLGNADKEIFRNILQDAYNKQLDNFAILVSIVYGNGTGTNTLFKTFLVTATQAKRIIDKPTSINFAGFCQDLISSGDLVFNKLGLAVTLSWSGDTLSISTIILRNLKQRYLDTNNTDYAYTPTGDYNPATKKYVDDKATTKQDTLVSGTNIKTINNESILGSGNINIQGGGSTIQYDVMPTASSEYVDKIIQYTGTNGTYKNGYFYKCKSNTIPSKIITTGASLLPLNIHIDNHKFELKFKPTTLDGWHKLMATEEDGYGAVILTNESTAIFGIDGNYYYQYDIDWQSENLYTALYNGDDGMFGINGTTVDTITSYDNTYYLNLFASNSENMDEAYKGEFYGLKVWNKTNDELIMNLVPSQNNNTPALYDTINQTYYYDNYSSMTYVAGGTTYYWERVDIQPSSNITGLDFTWENSWQKINASDKLLGQFLDIVNNYNENILKPYSLGSYLLSSVSMQGQDQGSDYTAFELAFEKIEDRNDKKRYIYFYANYNQTEIYDSEDATYYPKTGSEQVTILASSDDFLNYLSKYNTDEYVPISDFNPATKAYVDSNTIQKTELPNANQNVGKVYQFIGNSTYKKGGFYTSVSSGQLETALQVNDNSKYELNFNYNGDDRVEIKFKPFNEHPDDLGILGNNDNDGNQLQVHFYDENIYVGTGTEEVSASMYVPNTDYVVVIHGDNDSIIINNNVIQTGATFGYSSNSILCSYNDNTNFRGLFYYMKVYDAVTGNLKYNFVPDTYNGTVAIHETINDNYVYNTYTENNTIVQVSGEYIWKEVNDYFEPTVITSSDSTYTIANLQRNMVYKLGELSALTITACEDFHVASTIYFTSGSTPTTISLPNNVTGVDNTISANKSYIVEIKNRIAIFKEY